MRYTQTRECLLLVIQAFQGEGYHSLISERVQRILGRREKPVGWHVPYLRELEEAGLIVSEEKTSYRVTGSPRIYYRITPKGAALLEEWESQRRLAREDPR